MSISFSSFQAIPHWLIYFTKYSEKILSSGQFNIALYKASEIFGTVKFWNIRKWPEVFRPSNDTASEYYLWLCPQVIIGWSRVLGYMVLLLDLVALCDSMEDQQPATWCLDGENFPQEGSTPTSSDSEADPKYVWGTQKYWFC